MSGLVEGKVALVTGAASGIGRASAVAFAREGARVGVADVDEAGGLETVALITEAGGEAAFFRCDIAQEDDVRSTVEGVVATFGGLHCAHNNAGISIGQVRVADIEREQWDRILSVNLTGTWLCMVHELRYMAEHGGGAIVATSSTTSVLGSTRTAAYAATKGAINQLVHYAAVEYAPQGIRVNAILPGPIVTDLTGRAFTRNPALQQRLEAEIPAGRMGEPSEVAEAAVWLCSDRAPFITGVELIMDGGKVLF